jgi:hypothetical protein
MGRRTTNDEVFMAAKKKLGEAINKPEVSNADLVKLCETLAKMREVELQAEDGNYGSALGGDT